MEKAPKKNNSKLKLVMAVMVTAALFIAELYVIINQSNNMVLVIGIAVFILIALYFVIDAILDCVNKNNITNKEQYDNIYKSSKASYMLLKKNLDELSKQIKFLNDGNDKNEAGSAEIIKSQKAIARVAMSKNKDTQDRLFVELNNLEASLNDSICGLSEKLSGFQEEIERLADHIARINEEAILTASKSSQEFASAVEEESPIFEDVLNDSFEEETVLKESEADVVSELEELDSLFVDSIDDVEEPENELDFGDIDLGSLDIEESASIESDDDILSQLLATEEVPLEKEVDVLAELTKAEENPTPTPMPADNGGKMGQDDIAALIASMTGGDTTPVPESIPEPAPVPVDNNPNRMMTPEEIAALIAGANN